MENRRYGHASHPRSSTGFFEIPGMTEIENPPQRGPRAEVIVARCFRHGMQAVTFDARAPWSFAWQELADACSPEHADPLLRDLSRFVRAVQNSAGRRIEVYPAGCPGFCRDECLAVSMIAASQHGSCPALRACAYALLQSNSLDWPLHAAGQFARRLAHHGHILSSAAVVNAADFVAIPAGLSS